MLNRNQELIGQVNHPPSFLIRCGPGLVVRSLAFRLNASHLVHELSVEQAWLDERAAKLVPRSGVCLRVDVALAERGTSRVEHRVVGGAEGSGGISANGATSEGEPASRGLEEFG